ncbi:MAG: hypothetical protein Q8932_19945 [Bacteroidota bacterium]|nr:hypothetical protein [Bacteroidota bacterium]
MADTKIGFNQLDKPAPLYYRRFTNAYIVCILPAVSALCAGWGFSDKASNRIGLMLIFSAALVKGVGMVLGNGQDYVPTNQQGDQSP